MVRLLSPTDNAVGRYIVELPEVIQGILPQVKPARIPPPAGFPERLFDLARYPLRLFATIAAKKPFPAVIIKD
jgi:hypothetical protein